MKIIISHNSIQTSVCVCLAHELWSAAVQFDYSKNKITSSRYTLYIYIYAIVYSMFIYVEKRTIPTSNQTTTFIITITIANGKQLFSFCMRRRFICMSMTRTLFAIDTEPMIKKKMFFFSLWSTKVICKINLCSVFQYSYVQCD